MREAQYIHTLVSNKLNDVIHSVETCGASFEEFKNDAFRIDKGFIVPAAHIDLRPVREAILRHLFTRYPAEIDGPVIHITLSADPHIDECTYTYTVGLVLVGDHVLYTNRGLKVCALEPGVVYLLNNQRLHGAHLRDEQNPTPLVFVSADFLAASIRDALQYVT